MSLVVADSKWGTAGDNNQAATAHDSLIVQYIDSDDRGNFIDTNTNAHGAVTKIFQDGVAKGVFNPINISLPAHNDSKFDRDGNTNSIWTKIHEGVIVGNATNGLMYNLSTDLVSKPLYSTGGGGAGETNPDISYMPNISIEGNQITEGNSGNQNLNFTVSLSGISVKTITVNYDTINDSAIVGSDYNAVSGTLTFLSGETSQTITVQVLGDTIYEDNEQFYVILSSPSNANLNRDTGVGTINNDDINEVPNSVELTNAITTLAENTDTTAQVKIADIVITDDALGIETIALSGADASLFEVVGTTLFLKAGAALDFETNPQLNITVVVDDTTVSANPDVITNLVITITDINEEVVTPPEPPVNDSVSVIGGNETESTNDVLDLFKNKQNEG